MTGLAIALLIVGIVAGALGFTGVAGTATWVAQLLFFLFLIGFIVTLLWGSTGRTGS